MIQRSKATNFHHDNPSHAALQRAVRGTLLAVSTLSKQSSCFVSCIHHAVVASKMRKRQSLFAFKLHDMLNEMEKRPSLKAIVSWEPHGRAFIVHNTFLFIMEANKRRFFKQTKYASFQRQLNLYGFSRISSGIDKGAYHHKLFLRGMPGLCHRIQRLRIKGTKVRKPASPATEPNFYSMPACLPPTSSHGRVNQEVGPYPPAACQTMPPKSSFSAPMASALKRNNDMLTGPAVPSAEWNVTKGNNVEVSLRMTCELANQSPEVVRLNFNHTLKTDPLLSSGTLSQPLYAQGQTHHVKEVMITASHSTEKQLIEESTHITLDRNDSVIVRALKGLGGQVLSPSDAKISSRTSDLTRFPRPCQLTREVTDSPDRAGMRQLDNKHVSCTKTNSDETPVSENIPFVLHLPTYSGQPNTSQSITSVQAVDSQPNCKISQSQANPRVEIDRNALSGSGLIDGFDHPMIFPRTRLLSDEEKNEYDWTMGVGFALNRSSLATSEQEESLGLERLPADTEFEAFIALRMTAMDRNLSVGTCMDSGEFHSQFCLQGDNS